MKNKKNIIITGIGLIAVVIIFVFIMNMDLQKEKNETVVGFIMSGSKDDEGWNGMHYDGIKEATDEINTKLIVKENVAEFKGECKNAVKQLAKEKADIIILSSYNYSQEVAKLVKKYPKIAFYGNSSEYHDKNLSSYFVRYYQGRYLSGVLAGLQTKKDKIGYVAAMSNNEVNRGINAFTLGVKSVNEDAEVFVKWTDTWDDEKKEKKAANLLIEKVKVDVVAYHQNQSYVIEEADKKDVYSIGYHQAFDNFSDKYLTSVVCNWKLVYKEMIKEYEQGRANEHPNFWIGMERDVVGLSKYSSQVSDKTKKEIEKAKNRIIKGKDVFSGNIKDNKGKKRCEEGEIIQDEILLEQMDWFVEGVKIYEE